MKPSEYKKEIKLAIDSSHGYYYFCDSHHPLAHKNTKVYYHRHMASIKIGRWVKKDEHVHHVDGNKLNNIVENLIILTSAEHTALHMGGAIPITNCLFCKKEFKPVSRKIKYCSRKCSDNSNVLFHIEEEILRLLVWEIPQIKIAKMYGVSDHTIGNKCELLKIEKPGRGYWQKRFAQEHPTIKKHYEKNKRKGDFEGIEHGVGIRPGVGYDRGCRCISCKEYHSKRLKEYRDKLKMRC